MFIANSSMNHSTMLQCFRNDDELKFLGSERAQMDNQMMAQQQNTALLSSNSSPLDLNDSPVDENIRGEILQLKHRLAGTDIELQRTNTTLRFDYLIVFISYFVGYNFSLL